MGKTSQRRVDKKTGGGKSSKPTRMNPSIQLAHFNRALALDRVGGDEELLREVAQLFLHECPNLLGQIRTAVTIGDASRVMEIAHTMKGSLATIGAENGAQTALVLEMMGRRKELSGSTEALLQLESSLSILREALSQEIA
jgi:two-component system, sensor histidine kinase and response regulator